MAEYLDETVKRRKQPKPEIPTTAWALPILDAHVPPVDERDIEHNMAIDTTMSMASVYRVALLQIAWGSSVIRKDWCDPFNPDQPHADLIRAAANCPLRYRHKDYPILRKRVIKLARAYRGLPPEKEAAE